MNRLKTIAIPGLRLVLGVVVLLEAVHFVFSSSSIQHFARTGVPQWIRLALGGSEIVGALLFLILPASAVGAVLLLAVFAAAVILHFHHGQFDVGALLVYAMAAIVCLAYGRKEETEVPRDRR
jgi:hypothetical protein